MPRAWASSCSAAAMLKSEGVDARFAVVGEPDAGNTAALPRAELEHFVEAGASSTGAGATTFRTCSARRASFACRRSMAKACRKRCSRQRRAARHRRHRRAGCREIVRPARTAGWCRRATCRRWLPRCARDRAAGAVRALRRGRAAHRRARILARRGHRRHARRLRRAAAEHARTSFWQRRRAAAQDRLGAGAVRGRHAAQSGNRVGVRTPAGTDQP